MMAEGLVTQARVGRRILRRTGRHILNPGSVTDSVPMDRGPSL
jgi:hypothetical protein